MEGAVSHHHWAGVKLKALHVVSPLTMVEVVGSDKSPGYPLGVLEMLLWQGAGASHCSLDRVKVSPLAFASRVG